MAMQLELNGEGKITVLAKVLSPTSYGKSIYVRIPSVGVDRRTDGGARDITQNVEFLEDIESYDRGDYVKLTFEPKNYGAKHKLTEVKDAVFTDPINADEPKFSNTDIPKVCPICGREASALIKTEYDSMTGGKINDSADACSVNPNNRGAWFDFSGEHSFVH